MILVITPPAVSIPNDKGVTSSNSISYSFSPPFLVSIAAYTAAPNATASSGFTVLLSSLPLKNSLSKS